MAATSSTLSGRMLAWVAPIQNVAEVARARPAIQPAQARRVSPATAMLRTVTAPAPTSAENTFTRQAHSPTGASRPSAPASSV